MTQPATDLHVRVWGAGERVVLLHGSNVADPGAAFVGQRPLAVRYELVVPDRRGYGQSSETPVRDLMEHARDAIALLEQAEGGAHLVGHSSGGVIALLVAGERPDLVRSLMVIEPPTFRVAAGNPVIDELLALLDPVHAAGPAVTPEEFLRGFMRVWYTRLPADLTLRGAARTGVSATKNEPAPQDAAPRFEVIAAQSFPKLVVSGGWTPRFEITCDVLAGRIAAGRLVLPGRDHSPHHLPEFNDHLTAVLARSGARAQ